MIVSSHEMHGKANVFNRFVDRHPYLGALILVVMLLVVLRGVEPLFGLAMASIFPAHSASLSFLQKWALGEIPKVLLVVGLISILGWWADTGFTRWSTRQGLVVCLSPFALAVLGILYVPFGSLNAPLITGVTGVVLALAVGFVEEGFFRGLLLRILLPKGIVLSVMLSSVVFACFHLANLFSGVPWSYVALQLISTVGFGSLLAALRLRAVSIWPPILLHALHDVPFFIMLGGNPNQVFDIASPLSFLSAGIGSLLYMAYAAYLLRPRQLARLSLVYNLATTSGSDEAAKSRLKRLRPATMPSASVEPTGADDVSDRPTRPLAPIAMLSEVACLLPCGHKQRSLHARFCSVCGTPIASSPFVREQPTC